MKAWARATARFDAEMLEKGAPDQMRRLATHRADAEVDARLPEPDRQKLGMRVGEMKDTRVAKAADVVKDIVVGPRRSAE